MEEETPDVPEEDVPEEVVKEGEVDVPPGSVEEEA